MFYRDILVGCHVRMLMVTIFTSGSLQRFLSPWGIFGTFEQWDCVNVAGNLPEHLQWANDTRFVFFVHCSERLHYTPFTQPPVNFLLQGHVYRKILKNVTIWLFFLISYRMFIQNVKCGVNTIRMQSFTSPLILWKWHTKNQMPKFTVVSYCFSYLKGRDRPNETLEHWALKTNKTKRMVYW